MTRVEKDAVKALIQQCVQGEIAARIAFQEAYGPLIYAFPVRFFHLHESDAGAFYLYAFEKERIFKRLQTFQERNALQFTTYLSFHVLRDLVLEWRRTQEDVELLSLDTSTTQSTMGDHTPQPLEQRLTSTALTPEDVLVETEALDHTSRILAELAPGNRLLLKILCLLESGAADVLAGHVATCQRCTQTMRQWATAQQVVGEVWLRRQTDSYNASTTSTCPGQPEMLNAVSGLLTPQERADLDAHLRDCDACLVQMRALRRTVRLLRQEHWLAPPEPLRRSARNAIVGSATRLGMREMARVVIEVVQRGLKVLEASWDPVTLDMQIMPLSASVAALRTQRGEEEQGMAIRHVMGDIALHITLIPEAHNTVRLSFRAQKQSAPLSQALVTIHREGRTVYARRLSVAGEMQAFQLTDGEYTISLAQEGVAMTVVLQTPPA